MAKKINKTDTINSFESLYEQLTNIVAEIEADETPLESFPKLMEDGAKILEILNNKLRVIEDGLQIKTGS